MYGMNKDELRLLPHDPAWAEDFLAEKTRLAAALNDDAARIEHVGSTSIATVHAKPILDIAILCGSRGLEAAKSALTKLGYEYRGQFNRQEGHFYAVLDDGKTRLCQAHIFAEPTADWHAKLLFRDVLNRRPDLAREYDRYKLNLAKTARHKNEYAEIKTRWVDVFMTKIVEAGRNLR